MHNLRLRDRIWLRIRDPNSSRRKLSDDSKRVIKFFQDWISGLQPLRPRPYWQGHAAADAMASGSTCQIGGFVTNQLGHSKWFSEKFTHEDFKSVGLELKPDLQKALLVWKPWHKLHSFGSLRSFFPAIVYQFASNPCQITQEPKPLATNFSPCPDHSVSSWKSFA